MSIRSKIRDWIFPSKDDSFDNSYDYLLEFFNSLDEEFGGLADFLFDYKIKKFFRTQVEISNSGGAEGDFALYIKNGDILRYSSLNGWEVVDRIGKLPKIRPRDPDITDIAYDSGQVWINSASGKAFKFVGSALVDDNNGDFEAIWVNQNGKVDYYTANIKQFLFYPKIDLHYKTKTLRMVDGQPTFEDDNLHIEGQIGEDGVIQYFDFDTHVDLFLRDFLVGTLIIKRKNIQTFMDLEFFNPEGGLPEQGTPEIVPWNQRFDRLLRYISHSALVSKNVNNDILHNHQIGEILDNGLTDFLTDNNLLAITSENMADYKARYRVLFTSLTDIEMSIDEKKWAIYLLADCFAMTAYDGNLYNVDGNDVLADGNIEPPCV